MDETEQSGIPWMEDPGWPQGTSAPPEPSVSEDSPMVLLLIVVGGLATMSLIFSFALLIDCRNQQVEETRRQSNNGRTTRLKKRIFKLPIFVKARETNAENLAFASQVCEENRNTEPMVSNSVSPTAVYLIEPSPSSSSIQC